MRKVAVLTLSVFVVSVFLSGVVVAGKIVSVQPADVQQVRQLDGKMRAADRDVKVYKGSSVQAKGVRGVVTAEDDCNPTLTWRTLEDPNVNFGAENDDSMSVWFQAPGDLRVLGVRFMALNFEGNVLVDIFESPYEGYTGDAVDGDGWLSGGDHPTGITSPLGAHVSGPVPKTIGTADLGEWMEVMLPVQPEFSAGDNFCVSLWHQRTAGWGFATEYPYGAPYSFFKYYALSTGPDETNTGWFLRSYVLWYEVIAELTGDTPPDFVDFEVLLTAVTSDPRPVSATVTDKNCAGGDAGVAHVWVNYSTDGVIFDQAELTAGSDVYSGEIPGFAPGTTVSYYYSAEDVEGNVSRTAATYSYYIWTAVYPNLAVYNTGDMVGATVAGLPAAEFCYFLYSYYWFGDFSDACGCFYAYDFWDVNTSGQFNATALADYDNVMWIDGSYPSTAMPADEIGAWLETGTAAAPKSFFLTSQDIGCFLTANECTDIDFAPEDFFYKYMGIDVLGPQDVADTELVPTGDCLSKDVADLLAGGVGFWGEPIETFNYGPELFGGGFDFGATNYLDRFIPAPHAVPAFVPAEADPGEVAAVSVVGDGWATAFFGFDVWWCTYGPHYETWIGRT